MLYLILGAIIALGGVGLIMTQKSLPGIILLLIGVFIGLKGHRDIDKNR